jgi:hypothetical protein
MYQGNTRKAHNKQTVIDLHQHNTREEHTRKTTQNFKNDSYIKWF